MWLEAEVGIVHDWMELNVKLVKGAAAEASEFFTFPKSKSAHCT
jgi:hypothetical protein